MYVCIMYPLQQCYFSRLDFFFFYLASTTYSRYPTFKCILNLNKQTKNLRLPSTGKSDTQWNLY